MKIVIAEDDLVSRKLLERAVTKLGYPCHVASDGEEAWELYEKHAPEVIISDWMMPRLDGIDLCRRLRESQGSGYTYFILLTSLTDKEDRLRGMQAGADDYLTKPLDLDELQLRMIAARRITALHKKLARQATELERINLALYEDGRVDSLTQIGNRRMMEENLERVHAECRRYDRHFAVALFDIDFFKKYNDTCGHPAGDETLRAVAGALSEGCRAEDSVYRYGGEEFLAVLPGQDLKTGVLAAERLRSRVEALGLPHPGKTPPGTVTVSGGVACSTGASDLDAVAMVERADQALYQAKESGRNRVLPWTK